MYIYIYIYIYYVCTLQFLQYYCNIINITMMVFATEGFLEVAIERCPEWDLKPRPMNCVQTL